MFDPETLKNKHPEPEMPAPVPAEPQPFYMCGKALGIPFCSEWGEAEDSGTTSNLGFRLNDFFSALAEADGLTEASRGCLRQLAADPTMRHRRLQMLRECGSWDYDPDTYSYAIFWDQAPNPKYDAHMEEYRAAQRLWAEYEEAERLHAAEEQRIEQVYSSPEYLAWSAERKAELARLNRQKRIKSLQESLVRDGETLKRLMAEEG